MEKKKSKPQNIWDELWSRKAFNFLSYHPDVLQPVEDVVAVDKSWLIEVKTEGDRIKKELESWKEKVLDAAVRWASGGRKS